MNTNLQPALQNRTDGLIMGLLIAAISSNILNKTDGLPSQDVKKSANFGLDAMPSRLLNITDSRSYESPKVARNWYNGSATVSLNILNILDNWPSLTINQTKGTLSSLDAISSNLSNRINRNSFRRGITQERELSSLDAPSSNPQIRVDRKPTPDKTKRAIPSLDNIYPKILNTAAKNRSPKMKKDAISGLYAVSSNLHVRKDRKRAPDMTKQAFHGLDALSSNLIHKPGILNNSYREEKTNEILRFNFSNQSSLFLSATDNTANCNGSLCSDNEMYADALNEEIIPIPEDMAVMMEDFVFAAVGAVMSVVTVAGNLIVVAVILLEPRLRRANNYYLMSLALSDLYVGIVAIPLYTYSLIRGSWHLGQVLCKIWIVCDFVIPAAAIHTVFLITLDRYWSVMRPVSYRNWMTDKKVFYMVTAAWVLPTLWQPALILFYIPDEYVEIPNICQVHEIPFLYDKWVSVGYSVVQFWLIAVVIVVLYYNIYKIANKVQKKSTSKLRAQSAGMSKLDYSQNWRYVSADCEGEACSRPFLETCSCSLSIPLYTYNAASSVGVSTSTYGEGVNCSRTIVNGNACLLGTSLHVSNTASVRSSPISTDFHLEDQKEMRKDNIHHNCQYQISIDYPQGVGESSRPEKSERDVIDIFCTNTIFEPVSDENVSLQHLKNGSLKYEMSRFPKSCESNTNHNSPMDQQSCESSGNVDRPPCAPRTTSRSVTIKTDDEEDEDIDFLYVNKHGAEKRIADYLGTCVDPATSRTDTPSRSTVTTTAGSKLNSPNALGWLRTITAIVSAFLFCYAPYNVITLIPVMCGQFNCVPKLAHHLTYFLWYLNSALNPFLYAYANEKFRHTALKYLKIRVPDILNTALFRPGTFTFSSTHSGVIKLAPSFTRPLSRDSNK